MEHLPLATGITLDGHVAKGLDVEDNIKRQQLPDVTRTVCLEPRCVSLVLAYCYWCLLCLSSRCGCIVYVMCGSSCVKSSPQPSRPRHSQDVFVTAKTCSSQPSRPRHSQETITPAKSSPLHVSRRMKRLGRCLTRGLMTLTLWLICQQHVFLQHLAPYLDVPVHCPSSN
ncbi:uncharacterized protein LOC144051954 isoform X2 [Vanacampus margaritifer]